VARFDKARMVDAYIGAYEVVAGSL
jgi:hypothetical protein